MAVKVGIISLRPFRLVDGFVGILKDMYFGKLVELADGDSLYRWPVHPYTRSLLSAIPQPNPLTEKKRSRLVYEPDKNSPDDPTRIMREVEAGHFVYATEQELELYKNGGGL